MSGYFEFKMRKLLSNIYNNAVKKRNINFDIGKSKIYRCSKPVISVGNLSIGGSGKTPFVITLSNIIKDLGYKPAIVGRGYKRKSKGEIIVSDGNKILTDAKSGGDEMFLLAQKLNVPVISNDLKYKGAMTAEKMFDIDCIVIDDGFQHRQLHRTLDILLIDSDTLDKPYLLPYGRLREPLESVKRADIICLVGNIESKTSEIKKFIQNKFVCKIKVVPDNPYFLNENKSSKITVDRLSETQNKIISVCGIAKPKNFSGMLKALKFNIIYKFEFEDHHNYKESNIQRIIQACKLNEINLIATTEKDAVKFNEFGNIFAENNINILIFPISIKFDDGENEFKNILKNLLGKKDG
ncbi:tetraacyldisaccharide 4'-kinase [Bacteroidetes/Chlorobi group bacterium ChocPot_Mid]|jgi:tetraacyldisaccharide 4'-kinase|nr:MAG: tetraacyldisaccharide 4'-kinase [Bacteroidetes/Chlorobi group bacterium ChocPot_Mid]